METYYTSEYGFLEELLGLSEMDYYTNQHEDFNNIGGWSLDFVAGNNIAAAIPNNYTTNTNPNFFDDYFSDLPLHDHSTLINNNCSSSYAPFGDDFSPPVDSSPANLDAQMLPYCQEADNYHYYSMSCIDDNDQEFGNRDIGAPCKMEPVPELPPTTFSMGFCGPQSERKNSSKVKKLDGQPSKNLMAERRRRKRLNDRLSMLRSVVPKISKMDRTSILGDTIEYMKELLERINMLQKEMDLGSNELSLMSMFKDVKPNAILVRNSPKFDVERRNEDTRIEICCGGKPGLLQSTVTTLEALGLEIQHCVISCFSDFALQASCSEEFQKRAILESEDIKQALVRNAGYGGRCL